MRSTLSELAPIATTRLMRAAKARTKATSVLLVAAVVYALVAVALMARFQTGSPVLFARSYFVVDAGSRLFVLLINVVFLGVATYVLARVRNEPALEEGIARYVGFAIAFITASDLAVLSHHILATWVFLEVSTLAAVPLIQYGGRAAALSASWRYFLFSSVGLGLVFLGFTLIYGSPEATGASAPTYFIYPHADVALAPSLWHKAGLTLVLLGLGTKLGLAPMYSWLPETYDAAPPATAAMLAAIQFNVALVFLLRFLQVFRATDPTLIRNLLLGLGLVTMAVSSLNVIAARRYKRLIAYASLNHGGVIAVGLGLGTEAAYGVILYVVSNALIKAILFLTAGNIRSQYRTDDIREVSGLIKDMPYTGILFMVGIFALLGLPPFGSFLGELLIMSGLIGGGYTSIFAAFGLILTVTFVATGRAVFPMIWGESRKTNTVPQRITPVIPKLVFLAALIAMGLYLPPSLNELFRTVASRMGAP